MIMAKEDKISRYVTKTRDHSAIGLRVYHKASNGLISYGNGPLGA